MLLICDSSPGLTGTAARRKITLKGRLIVELRNVSGGNDLATTTITMRLFLGS